MIEIKKLKNLKGQVIQDYLFVCKGNKILKSIKIKDAWGNDIVRL